MSVVRLIAVRESELSVDEVRAAVADPAAGGIALFAGAVRDSDHDQGVTGLSYSAHPSAAGELRRVAEVIAEKYPVIGIAAVHRVGDLAIGDLAVVAGRVLPAPGRGVRRLPGPDRHPEGLGADLEAPAVRRRHRRVGRHPVSREILRFRA